jgi:hypothetical protein
MTVMLKNRHLNNTFAKILKPYWYRNDFIGFQTCMWQIGEGIVKGMVKNSISPNVTLVDPTGDWVGNVELWNGDDPF